MLLCGHGKSIYSSAYTFSVFCGGQHPAGQRYPRPVPGGRHVGVRVDRYEFDVGMRRIFRRYAQKQGTAHHRAGSVPEPSQRRPQNFAGGQFVARGAVGAKSRGISEFVRFEPHYVHARRQSSFGAIYHVATNWPRTAMG